MKPKISDLQIAVFTPSLDFSNKILIANSIFEGMPDVFETNPTMLPVPNDAPAEIPRIILKNSNSSYMMNVGLNRFDFYYHDREMVDRIPTKEVDEIQNEAEKMIKLLAKTIKNNIGLKIIRLGFVPTFVNKSDDATQLVRDTFFKTSKIPKNISEINYAIRKKEKVDNSDVNVGVNGSAYRMPNDELDNKVVVFNIDINTPPENPLDLTVDQVVSFYNKAFIYVKEHGKELMI
ncbi:MAG: hypothetical protein Q8P10_02370 [bacterium]|nr:hypothetical protein [bacterium]